MGKAEPAGRQTSDPFSLFDRSFPEVHLSELPGGAAHARGERPARIAVSPPTLRGDEE